MKIVFISFLLIVGCSSLQTSPYRTQVEDSTSQSLSPAQIMDEEGVDDPKGAILFSWPLRGQVYFSRGFFLGASPHHGIDLAVNRGEPVYASHAGYVEYAGQDFSGYGKLIIINSGTGWATFYAHLDSIQIREGQRIKRGQKIGTVGRTGNARGTHLHFELRHNEKPVDPIPYLPKL